MKQPKRKRQRLENYDYTQNGGYFVTICTHNRAHLLGDIIPMGGTIKRDNITDVGAVVGADSISARMVADIWEQTMGAYSCIHCPKYVVMPNHIHAIIMIERADMESAPTVSEVIQSFKRHSTVRYIALVKEGILPPFDKKIWQRSYHDHIIRTHQEYLDFWQYIENNPDQWELDQYYEKLK